MIRKFFFLLVVVPILLAGCGGADGSGAKREVRAGETFTVDLPQIGGTYLCDARRGRTSYDSTECKYTAPQSVGNDRLVVYRSSDNVVYATYNIEVVPY